MPAHPGAPACGAAPHSIMRQRQARPDGRPLPACAAPQVHGGVILPARRRGVLRVGRLFGAPGVCAPHLADIFPTAARRCCGADSHRRRRVPASVTLALSLMGGTSRGLLLDFSTFLLFYFSTFLLRNLQACILVVHLYGWW